MAFGYHDDVRFPVRSGMSIGEHILGLVNNIDVDLAAQNIFAVEILGHIVSMKRFIMPRLADKLQT